MTCLGVPNLSIEEEIVLGLLNVPENSGGSPLGSSGMSQRSLNAWR